jgi:transposase InsO family protein
MCKILEVSPAGYYGWQRHTPSSRDKRREELTDLIVRSFERSYRIYGYRKVHQDLVQDFKVYCCKETVRKIMRANFLRSKVRKKFIRTTDSDHDYPTAGNILNGKFTVDKPDTVWVADITYIRTGSGWLYLSAIMDLYGRRIVGWSMSDRIDTKLVRDALGMALLQRGKIQELLHHSDQGSQYCSYLYQKELERNGIVCSMSRRGNCWDNACMESFFGSLKSEWIGDTRYASREEAKINIFTYIEMFYNRQRRHASLGYVTPVEFEEQYEKDHVA